MRRSPLPSGLRWPSPDRSCCPPTPGPPTPGGHLSSTDTPYRYREADVRPSRVLIQETNSANSTGFQTPVRTNRRTKPQVTAPADTRHTARSGLLIRRFWVRVPGGVRHEGPGQSTWPGPLLLPGRSSNAAFPEWHGLDLSPYTSGPVGRRRTYLSSAKKTMIGRRLRAACPLRWLIRPLPQTPGGTPPTTHPRCSVFNALCRYRIAVALLRSGG
jgi:hypothetical protein